MNKHKLSIRRKLITAFLIVLIVPLIFLSVSSEVGMVSLRAKSENMLIDQALKNAQAFVDGKADTINEQLSGIVSDIAKTAAFASYIYENPDEFVPRTIKTPDEFEAGETGNLLHWLPFEKSEKNDPAIVAEANMLTALEPQLEVLAENCPTLVSLYAATKTHVNIGYDKNVSAKVGIGQYDPIAADAKWYTSAMQTGEVYISDTYSDTFGRGLMVTISVPYKVNGEIHGVIGADINIENISSDILNIDAGNGGSAMLFSSSGAPICAEGLTENTDNAELLGRNANAVTQSLVQNSSGTDTSTLNSSEVYIVHSTVNTTGWRLAAVLSVDGIIAPAKEAGRYITYISIILFVLILAVAAVMLIIANRLCKNLSSPIIELTGQVVRIGEGNLDYRSEVETGDEIETLSKSFERMTVSLKEYIGNLTAVTAEKERIGAELNVAKHIQSSMLPCIFPAFPERKEFDIFATMDPAKEVGGDFYDFFLIDSDHLAVVIADVSGKGVPASLFMVIAKTLIKNHAQLGQSPCEVFTETNNQLCEGNEEGLFVTAWMGVLEISTGKFTYVNAGHNPPLIRRKDGEFEYLKCRPGFVLAGMEGLRYRENELTLESGDTLYLYTDGVTEATDSENRLYGEERLKAVLDKNCGLPVSGLLPAVRADIDAFVKEAPQFDDITMLALHINTGENREERS